MRVVLIYGVLQGRCNIFGIVTNITLPIFLVQQIERIFYVTNSQTTKVLCAFYDSVNRATSGATAGTHDAHAANPIACLTYLYFRIQAVSVDLVCLF